MIPVDEWRRVNNAYRTGYKDGYQTYRRRVAWVAFAGVWIGIAIAIVRWALT